MDGVQAHGGLGARSATTVRIHSAPSQDTKPNAAERSAPKASKNSPTTALVRPLAAQITLPVNWSHTTVR